MTGPDSTDPGWVLHEQVGDGYAGWLYHYADGEMVSDDGTPYAYDASGALFAAAPDADALDPGWVFHGQDEEPGTAGWLYHYGDGAMVAEDGTAYEYVTDESATYEPQPPPQPWAAPPAAPPAQLEPEPEPSPELSPELGPRIRLFEPDPPGTGPRPRRHRHLRPYLGAAVLVLVGMAVSLLLTRPWSDPGTATPAAGTAFDPPEAVPDNSEYVWSRVLPSGAVEVDHWIRSRRVTSLVLRLPELPRATPGGPRVSAQRVRVVSEKGPQDGPRVVGSTPVRYRFASTPTLHVSYVLTGVVTRTGSVPGRALVRLASLDLSYPHDDLTKTMLLRGGRVLAAACAVDGSAAAPRPCGNAEGSQWRVQLEPDSRHDRVLAQVDLPRAQADGSQ